METTSASNANLSTSRHGFADRLQHSKALVAIVAVLGITVMALAAALVVNRSDAQPGGSAAMAPAALPAPATSPVPVPATAPKVAAVAPKATHPNTVNHSAPVTVAKATVCADCGTVEAVTAVKRPGQVNGVPVGNTTIGIGTVAGGVLGGILGNQVGNGNGKTLATVVGAAGGAYAGNKVEQSMKTVTVYDVRVRMNDGSVRNLDISTAPAVGSKVVVEGNNLRSVNGAG
jgi:outer membrane lipoprotein SlyB